MGSLSWVKQVAEKGRLGGSESVLFSKCLLEVLLDRTEVQVVIKVRVAGVLASCYGVNLAAGVGA